MSRGQRPKHRTIKLLCRPVCEEPPWIEARSQRPKQDHTQWTAELDSSFSLTMPSRGSSTYPLQIAVQHPQPLSPPTKKSSIIVTKC